MLVAVVGVGGTAVGANLTSEYSRGTARMADRRAAYVRFLGASAAYRQGRQRADTSKNEQDKAFEVLAKLTKDASSVGEKEREAAESLAADWVDLNASAAAALPPLTSDLKMSAATARLLGPRVREKVDALEAALLNGQNSEDAFIQALDAMSDDM
jgi:hypothetical protein